jgi:hypothetical protein
LFDKSRSKADFSVQKHAKTHFQLLQASVTSGELEMFPDILNIPNRNMAQQHFTLPQDHQVGSGTFLRKAGTLVDIVGVPDTASYIRG